MKKTLILLSILTSFVASAQSIEISPNGGTNASAILDLKSTTKGFLLPRMTNAQMRAIPSPAQGLLAFCTDCGTNGDYYFYKGTDWVALGSTTVSVSTTMGSVSANADEKGATITNGVLNLAPANTTKPGIITATDQTFGGVKTFSNGIVGNVTGNVTGSATTVTTNANLTGDVTSIGNAATVVKINGTSLSGLPTGILKNTTSTGVPTIATAGTDYQAPITLTTTGSGAATLSSNTLNIPNVSYTLPTATSSVLGGVKIDGTSITMNPDGVLSVTPASIGAQVSGSYLTSSTGVTSLNGSTTGLTPASATSGAVSLGGVLVGANGGTGVNNTGKTITLGGNLTTTGAFNTELTTTANTAVTLPITGTLATLAGIETLTNKTLTSPLLTGNPQAPTAPAGTITTQIATTEFVKANSVDLTTAQTIAGAKTFSSDLTVNGLTVGKGANGVGLNTAFGYNALVLNNQTGLENTAVGYNALASNTSGDWNTANGYNALKSNTTGQSNTSIGDESLLINTTGRNNTAIGVWALYSNIAGNNNTAIGNGALKLSTGNNNTAIGLLAGQTLTTGNMNILIGNFAESSTATVSNEITLGDGNISALRCKVTSITSLSDRRDKTNIIPIGEGLAFLKKLNPVSFTWNTRDKAKVGIKSAGFIAQELLALQKQSTIGDNLDLVSENNPEKLEARYGNLLPVVVKAIQEESAEKDKAIQELKERIYALEKLMDELLNKK